MLFSMCMGVSMAVKQDDNKIDGPVLFVRGVNVQFLMQQVLHLCSVFCRIEEQELITPTVSI